MAPGAPSVHSDQLNLELFPGVPWDGHSPRALTRVAQILILRRAPPLHEVFFNADQLEFWPLERPHRKKSLARISGGASLLLETHLTRREDGSRKR